jgi:cytochrome b561
MDEVALIDRRNVRKAKFAAQLRNSPQAYGAVAQLLHWLTVGLVAAAWLLGTYGDVLPRGAARAAGLFTHISIGLALIAVLTVPVGWRLLDPPPQAETTPFGTWLGKAAKLNHVLLYCLAAATPIVGIVLQFARGKGLPLFGLAEIASPWARDRALVSSLEELHETLANALVFLAAVHASAAFAHHWILRDRTLKRMLPGAHP